MNEENSPQEAALIAEMRLAYSQGDMSKTETLARTALNQYKNADISYYLCAGIHGQRRYSEAKPLLRSMLEEYPTYFNTYVLLAMIEYYESGPTNAVLMLERAMESGMDRGRVYLTIGQVHLEDDRPSEALAAYANVPEKSSSYLDSLIQMSYCYRKLLRRGKASECLTIAAKLDPDNVHIQIEHADLLVDQRRFSDARKAVNALIDRVGFNVRLEVCCCRLDLAQRMYDSAAAHMSNAIAVAPYQPYLYQNRAAASIKARKFKEAEEDIERAEQLGGTSAFLLGMRCRLHLRQFHLMDAAKVLKKYIKATFDEMDKANTLLKLQTK